jgi:CheY-like chemotaxis protein
LKIFVVEDEREVARLLAEALQLALAGHEPVVAYDGPEALAMLDRERPDVVFLDVRMPGMSGIDVLRRIRQADGALPVVLLTGHAGEVEVAEARRLGVSEIIRKPRILANLEGILGELQKSGSPAGPSGKVGYAGRIRREGSGCPRADAEPQG